MIADFKRIGLGTVQMGLDYGIANTTGQPSLTEIKSILTHASNLGIDLLDTAAAYGNSEKNIGKLADGQFKVISKWSSNPEVTLEQSLQSIKVTKLYGWLAHSGASLLSNLKDWEIMKYQQEKGLVKKIGFSLYNPKELEKLLDKNIIPDVVQIPFSVLDNRFAQWLHPLKELGCEIHCRSIYLQGLFFLKPDTLSSFFNPIKGWLKEVRQIAPDTEAIMAGLLRSVLAFKEIDKLIIGVDSNQQLKEMVTALTNEVKFDFPETPNFPEHIINPSLWPTKK